MRTFNCQYCGKENKYRYSSGNKYCNVKCQMAEKQDKVLTEFLNGTYTNKTGKFPGVAKDYVFEQQGKKCGICGIKDWNGQPIVFQADHIDGDSSNLKPNNLQMICPNCHSQTDTWGRKGIPLNKPKDDSRNQYRRNYYNLAKESA